MLTQGPRKPQRRSAGPAIRRLLIALGCGQSLLTPALGASCAGHPIFDEVSRDRPAIWQETLAEVGQIPNAQGLFWKIEKANTPPSWLLGTMHIPGEEITDFRPAIGEAFEHSGVVVLEIEDVSGAGKEALAEKVLAVAQLAEGESFDRGFTKQQMDTLGEMTAAIGMPYFVARRLQPWLLAISLAMPPCVHLAMLRGEEGVDEKLERLAVEAGKRVVGLETVDEQVAALATLEDVVGADALLELVTLGPGAIADLFSTQVQSYLEGQPSLAVALMLNMPEYGESGQVFRSLEGTLIRDRNLRMRDRLLPILDGGGAFVGVGALHLPGDAGLVELLRRAGYSVTRLQ